MQAGERVGPYEILSRIGEGGMGVAFSERFEREAQATAALKDYLVTELVDGRPLAGPVPAAEAIRYAYELAGRVEMNPGERVGPYEILSRIGDRATLTTS
jgi:hypothetical protein